MSRKEFDASRMRRMKRVAARHGLTIPPGFGSAGQLRRAPHCRRYELM